MNKHFKKIIILVVTIISLFIAWIYAGMFGFPWIKVQTENVSKKYLSEKYPDIKYKINKTYYNSKYGYYACSVITEGNLPITFDVKVNSKENIHDNYYEMKVNTEATNMITGLIKNSTPYIKYISVSEDAGANAVEDSYKKYNSFTPGNAYPLVINLVWNGAEMSLDEFVDKALCVREILKNNNISVCGLCIIDNTNNYMIDLNGWVTDGKMEGNYNFSKAEIIESKAAIKIKSKSEGVY
ncbi:MAG: hypothetical protein ACM3X7_07345 [Solirubrobacterales bacterium]